MTFTPIECRLPHITLAGIECGAGPLAIFLHGITANAHVFEPVMARLGTRFRCVSFDQRGHGGSGKPADGYLAEHFVEDVTLAITTLQFGRAMLIGHSLGARNALAAGVEAAHQLRAVIGIDFTPFIEPQVFDDLEARVGGGDRQFRDLDDVRAYLADRYRRLPVDAIERRALHGYAAGRGGLRPRADGPAMAKIARGLREDLVPVMEQIEIPTLLLRGAESKLVSPEAWARTHALRPDIAACELGGADHYVPEEVPDQVADVINDFWNSLDSDRRA